MARAAEKRERRQARRQGDAAERGDLEAPEAGDLPDETLPDAEADALEPPDEAEGDATRAGD